MFDFDCPKCARTAEIEAGDLPERSSDDMDWECPNCYETTKIGWYAEIESRE